MPNLRGKTWTTTTPANVEDAQYWEDHLISDAAAQKAASSVQTVNSTAPDANGNVDVVALPAGGTTGQVLTKISNTSGDADWLDPSSSGHTIKDEDGTTMAQQPTLQFLNADVTNDSVNSKTVVDCKGSKGDAATIAVGTTTTGAPGTSASVTNSGTSSAAVFDFTIPRGADGDDGVGVTGVVLESTSGKIKTYRMSFSDGNHFDYDVIDGADGTGAGDMLSTDYDPDSTVYNAGGIEAYVTSQAYTLPTAAANTLGGVKVGTNLSIDNNGVLSATDTTYVEVTTTASGLMSSSDKSKLDGIASGAQVNVQADWNVTSTSSDAYILNKPSIPAAQIQSNWGQTDNTKLDYIQNKPNIPNAANTGALNIQQNGVSAYTGGTSFNADSSSAATANIVTDDWVATGSVQSGSVTFNNINDTNNYGYKPYFSVDDNSTELNPTYELTTLIGAGTSSMSVTYTTNADDGTNNCKLRRIK